jgi:hypothetical protein
MTTFSDVIEEVISNLQGFSQIPDQQCAITSSIGTTTTTIPVADASLLGTGMAEIELEMVYISSVDINANTVTIPPYGRGYRGTTAATHASGVAITMAPSWPRNVVAREINNVITSIYPVIPAVKTAPIFQMDPIFTQYVLPVDAEYVLDVNYYDPLQLAWVRSTKWEHQHSAATTGTTGSTFATGKYVNLWDLILSGYDIQVTYAARPSKLVNLGDDFTNVSGLSDSLKDVVVLGVMAKMIQFAEVARIPVRLLAAQQLAPNNPVGSATNIARDLRQQYQQALLEEQRAFGIKYQPRVHRTR